MISKLFRHISRDDSIARLYGTIVAQARAPAFYQIYGVPDTVNGRLEMIMLHAVLVLRRLESEAMPVRALGQKLFDHFCRDMDDSMREMGVGDLAVPRKMHRISGAFYGRQAAYRGALELPGPSGLRRSYNAIYLPASRNAAQLSCLRPTSAKPCGGLPRTMDLRAANSPFPIPKRYFCARDREGYRNDKAATRFQPPLGRAAHTARRARERPALRSFR